MNELAPNNIIKMKIDYIAGIKVGDKVEFPTFRELAEKYNVTERQIYQIRKSDTDDWDKMRNEFMNRGIDQAFRQSALKYCKSIEDIYECLFLSLTELYQQGLDDIMSKKIKVRNVTDFVNLIKSITEVKEKQAGRDPLAMYDARIRDIWEKLQVDTDDIADKVAEKLSIKDAEFEEIEGE